MKKTVPHCTVVLLPILIGILVTQAIRDTGAQSHVLNIGGWGMTMQRFVQLQKDRGDESKGIIVGSIDGVPTICEKVSDALAAANIGSMVEGSRSYQIHISEKSRYRAIIALDADANKNHYTIWLDRPKEEKQRKDRYVLVASVRGEGDAPDQVTKALQRANIPAIVQHSGQTYMVRVNQENSSRAQSELEANAKLHQYGLVIWYDFRNQ